MLTTVCGNRLLTLGATQHTAYPQTNQGFPRRKIPLLLLWYLIHFCFCCLMQCLSFYTFASSYKFFFKCSSQQEQRLQRHRRSTPCHVTLPSCGEVQDECGWMCGPGTPGPASWKPPHIKGCCLLHPMLFLEIKVWSPGKTEQNESLPPNNHWNCWPTPPLPSKQGSGKAWRLHSRNRRSWKMAAVHSTLQHFPHL